MAGADVTAPCPIPVYGPTGVFLHVPAPWTGRSRISPLPTGGTLMAAVLKDTLKITKIKEHVGAEVTGVDLRKPLDAATRKRLNEAAAEHVALVIRDQYDFTPAEYQRAAENFGELMEDQNRRYIADG